MYRSPSVATAACVCDPGKSASRVHVIVAASNTSVSLFTSNCPSTHPPKMYSLLPSRATPGSTRVCGDAGPATHATNGAAGAGPGEFVTANDTVAAGPAAPDPTGPA